MFSAGEALAFDKDSVILDTLDVDGNEEVSSKMSEVSVIIFHF